GYQTSNVAYPDTNARYWLLRYTVRKHLAIELDGRFPDARYASVATYDAHRSSFTGPDGTPSALTDHQLLPDRGSGNPDRQPGRPGGKFTVTVTDTPAGRPNVLPLAPAGTPEGAEGTAVYRIYLPHGTFRLPKVTFVQGGHRVRVGTCADALSSAAPAVGRSGPRRPRQGCPGPVLVGVRQPVVGAGRGGRQPTARRRVRGLRHPALPRRHLHLRRRYGGTAGGRRARARGHLPAAVLDRTDRPAPADPAEHGGRARLRRGDPAGSGPEACLGS
ncbi:hypothetical protein AB0F45_33320, partial [Streptomyces achromogenes]